MHDRRMKYDSGVDNINQKGIMVEQYINKWNKNSVYS